MPSNGPSRRGYIPSMETKGDALTDNTIIVVLGASGDLAQKKTFPALFKLLQQDFLPKDPKIIGYARTKMDEAEFHKRETKYIKKPSDDKELADNFDDKLEELKKISTYVAGTYDEDSGFEKLLEHIEELEKARGGDKKNRVFYMALPPSVFTEVATRLKKICYSKEGVNRIIIEKPFGKDTESCREMISALKNEWEEKETFRIDHYLGKEMIKNILVLRFSNPFLDGCLNNKYVSNVQISFKEPFGTEGRGGYFDEFGIIRDVCQNHLLQTLSILAMERPVSFSSENVRDEKVKVLKHIPAIERKDVLLGQYVATGDKPGYKDDDTVPKDSNCPTFAAMTLWVNNARWEGVPFIMKAGKALSESKVEIRIQFKDATKGIFEDLARNELVMRIQPDEAVYIKLNSKLPGFYSRAIPTELDLTYKDRFTDARVPQAYEALILDALKGDHSNFVRDDELDVAWGIFTPILHWIDGKDGKAPKCEPYDYGSRGPKEIDEYTAKYGFVRASEDYHWPKTSVTKTMSE